MSQAMILETPAVRHAVILCHPSERSFNRAIADAYCDEVEHWGQSCLLRDLYALGFDPVLRADERPGEGNRPRSDVTAELDLLRECDVFVLIYPIWFGTPPAMLKGYVERVLGSGITPENMLLQDRVGFLTGKRLLSISTSATGDVWLDEQGQMASLRQVFDRYIAHAFGMQLEKHLNFGHIVPGTERRFTAERLHRVREEARRVCADALAEKRRRYGAAAAASVSL